MHYNGDDFSKSKPKPKLLPKASSVAILEEPLFPHDGFRSSAAGSLGFTTLASNTTGAGASPKPTVAVDISLRRGRIAIVTIVIVSVMISLAQFFKNGYEIRRYDKADLNAAEQKRLLDTYNSRSGTIVSAISKPIELFVAACVQVILLRLVSASLLRNEPSWKAVYGALVLSAGVGFLINNGFNALNVQLVELEIQSVVKASDLSTNTTAISSSSDWTSRVTTVSWSVSEARPRNPIANTVLRSLVQSRALRAKSVCTPSQYNMMFKPMPLDTVEYGFPQRDWMKQLLPEALPARSLTLLLNPTNKSANTHILSADLPMNASIASDLVLSAMILAQDFIPAVGSIAGPQYPQLNYNTSVAIRVGILPPDQSASDNAQKEWFLRSVDKFLTSAFSGTKNMTLTNIPANFTHVDVAPNISFDAVTFEFDVSPKLLYDISNEKTGARYMNEGDDYTAMEDKGFNCAPWPGRCLFEKRDPPVRSFTIENGDLYFDAPAQIQAFSICLNDNGTELMQSTGNAEYPQSLSIKPCIRVSSTSMLLVSVGKRITADALTQNTTANATGVYDAMGRASATNVRKIYSFTVGRLSWQTKDIAEAFGATCDVTTGKRCEGLTVELNRTSPGTTRQRLVVSADALPTDALLQPELNNFMLDNAYRQRPLTLVQVREPTRQLNPTDWYDFAAGDILYPHNVKNFTWDQSRKTSPYMCVITEERVQRVLDDHMYIEHPLQATYTAGLFFLLQNAVVKDFVASDLSSTTSTMLAFDGNTQKVALSISTPSKNALFTQLGCLLLFVGVAVSISWATIIQNSTSRSDLLVGITNAEVIARAKLDEKTFPSILLNRHITATGNQPGDRHEIEDAVITLLSLQLRSTNHADAVDRTTDGDGESADIGLSVHT